MKVTLETDDVLVVEDRPWAFGLVMIGVVVVMTWAALDNAASGNTAPAIASGGFALVLTAMLPLFIKRVMLTLNRQTDSVILTTRSVRRQTTQTYTLSTLDRAGFTTSKNSDGDTFHALKLFFATGAVPVTDIATTGDEASAAADAINAWLHVDSPAPAP